ncbi:arrestin domain-containing protein 1a isoform X2 [Clupea harengus]|uniref:Arrestin domain-containing protein 1a isoform X2 n=2 Tax=Clupea harengus TaxID=7950 RepID=A0A6P8FCI6_CLUHA|nr:arrestin domain-containing protein 1a isoform X2 [Clupea harengus]
MCDSILTKKVICESRGTAFYRSDVRVKNKSGWQTKLGTGGKFLPIPSPQRQTHYQPFATWGGWKEEMGKLEEFEISFTDNKVVYRPGDPITGTVKITNAEPIQCKAIKVNCHGFCGVSSRLNDTSWAAEEQYFNSTVSVADKGTLNKGPHTFPFKFLIPAIAPTSYEGPYGKTIFEIRAFVDTPRFSKDYKVEKTFFIQKPLNLNDVPDILDISSASVSKDFTYMFVKNGTIVLKATSDLRGYTPGQVIQLETEIQNKSGKSTSTVVASLMQKVTYKMKRPVHDMRTIAEVEGAGVKANKEAKWKEQIIVPPLPQSPLQGCELINIEYYIQVSLKSPDVLVVLPISIGNVSVDTTRRTPSRPVPAVTLSTPAAAPETTPKLPPRPAPRPAPRPRPRSCYVSPSAPLAEDEPLEAGTPQAEELPTKSHSQQQQGPGSQAASPHAFSYAPGLTFPSPQRQNGAVNTSVPLFSVSTGATIPFYTDSNATPVPTLCPLILPPDYGPSAYPHEPPPSYDETCNT